MYENTSDTKEQQSCQWKCDKESYYWTEPASYRESDYPKDSDQLDVQLCSNGIPYRCQCITRNKNDFQMNMISIFPYNFDETERNFFLCKYLQLNTNDKISFSSLV